MKHPIRSRQWRPVSLPMAPWPGGLQRPWLSRVRQAERLSSCLTRGLSCCFLICKTRPTTFTRTCDAPRRQHIVHTQTPRWCFFIQFNKYLKASLQCARPLRVTLWGT